MPNSRTLQQHIQAVYPLHKPLSRSGSYERRCCSVCVFLSFTRSQFFFRFHGEHQLSSCDRAMNTRSAISSHTIDRHSRTQKAHEFTQKTEKTHAPTNSRSRAQECSVEHIHMLCAVVCASCACLCVRIGLCARYAPRTNTTHAQRDTPTSHTSRYAVHEHGTQTHSTRSSLSHVAHRTAALLETRTTKHQHQHITTTSSTQRSRSARTVSQPASQANQPAPPPPAQPTTCGLSFTTFSQFSSAKRNGGSRARVSSPAAHIPVLTASRHFRTRTFVSHRRSRRRVCMCARMWCCVFDPKTPLIPQLTRKAQQTPSTHHTPHIDQRPRDRPIDRSRSRSVSRSPSSSSVRFQYIIHISNT